VPPGHIVCFTDEDDNHIFAKPGVHNIQDPFMKQRGGPIPLYGAQNYRNIIEHGDRCCVTVPIGMVALLLDFGQPLLLPPGLHTWKSDTIRFERMYRLDDSPVVQIGPYTILTVDAGYYAVTMNNGKHVLLQGGATHLLTHQKWKFERFINMKVQSEDLREINVASADNILMNIDATIVWKIVDAEKAAIMVTETIFRSDISLGTVTDDEGSVSKLRRDILKQAVAAIARFVSGINYAEYFNAVSSIMRIGDYDEDENDTDNENATQTSNKKGVYESGEQNIENPMFDYDRLGMALKDANQISAEFGVEIVSVSIISANPANKTLMNALSTSAVASAEALQAETHARGMARSLHIETRAAAAAKEIESEAYGA
jgi:regulator of protease activity HflC (stomatin/prohibitin superfamily)